ncbi:flavin-containing monooxygenase [Pseudomonas alkylphenolica]|uniref:4-hydroxyacetophenone monooxygenase n=1 Tax=Pseudomonas alkylphenolica TaxID=237609 RepID=A0A077FCB3_9PSED|nr:NAD(P)/FAD-dependent oxidoreductase [Pseudomonas alkylphenolica]AIL62265.1 4-hydroxyacetophenone monooxygenase [Pseudomonas alkylphenolica]
MRTYNTTLASLECDDETLRAHLQGADIPTLLLTVAHLTGDLNVLKPAWKPVVAMGVAHSGMTPEVEAEVREDCLQKLLAFRDSGLPVPARPSSEQLHALGTWLMGPVIEPYLPLVAEELVTAEEDPRAPRWHKDHVAAGREFKVVIIGAGESGMIAALRFKQAGVPFVVYEKGTDVGGTWRENTYPGCRIDINSFFYSFSFARSTWDDCFAPGPQVFSYMQAVARDKGLYDHIQFNTEVTDAHWDEDRQRWQLLCRDSAGQTRVDSNVVVFAVGQLNRPMIPAIPGKETFQGPAFHSAQWDHNVDWSGKRVAVIGTGASAAQFIPQLAKTAADLKVFARTTNWLLPTPDLHEKISDSCKWLLANLPNYSLWYRATKVMPQSVGFLEDVVVDVDYPPTEVAVSARNDQLRRDICAWMEPQFADRPDLRNVLIPDSPVGSKRIIRDNGTWISTLKRDNVSMIRQPIEAIRPTGICCIDGTVHEFDLIVYGTGFHASKFLMPINITGRDGLALREVWKDDDARAYMGMTVPGFPNMFCMYGPNTGLVVYSTIIQFSEFTATYIVDAVRLLLEGGHQSMEIKAQVFESYNQRVDQANGLRAWGFSRVNSWYKNSKGRVTQNFPFNAVEFWHRTHEVQATDYCLS